MKVVVTGSRNWRDADVVESMLAELPAGTLVIAGGAQGADRLAAFYVRRRGDLRYLEVRPDWQKHPERAGLIRNETMVDMLDRRTDRVIAFDNGTPGTGHCIDYARSRQIPVDLVWSWA